MGSKVGFHDAVHSKVLRQSMIDLRMKQCSKLDAPHIPDAKPSLNKTIPEDEDNCVLPLKNKTTKTYRQVW